MKKRIFNIIQIGYNQDTVSRAFDWFLVIVIILGIITMFLETFEGLAKRHVGYERFHGSWKKVRAKTQRLA